MKRKLLSLALALLVVSLSGITAFAALPESFVKPGFSLVDAESVGSGTMNTRAVGSDQSWVKETYMLANLLSATLKHMQ